MLSGRIMIVSDRRDVVDELKPLLHAGAHLAVSVANGGEALRNLQDGTVPDVLISDLGSEHALDDMGYIWRFRQLNRVGRHMAVVEDGAPFSAGSGARLPDEVVPLPRPFSAPQVLERVQEAVAGIEHDVKALRGEVWRELDRLQRSVRDVQREMVTALAQTIAERDPYMHGHCSRVAALSRRTGAQLGLPHADLETLETAALLHEIGKMSVPLELLHKTTPLTESELAQIRAHAEAGARIVGSVPSLQRIVPLVRYQNTDYRDLSAHLPESAREFLLSGILHVVDAYDAMVSARSYRGAMPREYWEATLTRGAGTRFHPDAVRAFFHVVATEEPACA